MNNDKYDEQKAAGLSALDQEDQEGVDLSSDNFDLDHFFNKAAAEGETAADLMPEGEDFEKTLGEAMSGNSELIDLMDEMDDESSFSLNKIVFPEELDQDSDYTGPVYGFYRKETGYHVIFFLF